MLLEKGTGIKSLTLDKQVEYVRESLSYNKTTGDLSWKNCRPRTYFKTEKAEKTWKTRYGGTLAGYIEPRGGYRLLSINHVPYPAHRIIFLLVEGRWPSEFLDHIDGMRDNNVWSNLREADQSVNSRNMKISKRNTSGVVGVSWDKSKSLWLAHGGSEGKLLYLGRYKEFEEAVEARKAWELSEGNFTTRHGK